MQQHAARFIAHTEASTGAELPRFVKDEFDAFLECGILAQAFLRLRYGECGHDKLLAFSCKRRGFCPSFGARRMSLTAAHLVDQGHVPLAVEPGSVTAPGGICYAAFWTTPSSLAGRRASRALRRVRSWPQRRNLRMRVAASLRALATQRSAICPTPQRLTLRV